MGREEEGMHHWRGICAGSVTCLDYEDKEKVVVKGASESSCLAFVVIADLIVGV